MDCVENDMTGLSITEELAENRHQRPRINREKLRMKKKLVAREDALSLILEEGSILAPKILLSPRKKRLARADCF